MNGAAVKVQGREHRTTTTPSTVQCQKHCTLRAVSRSQPERGGMAWRSRRKMALAAAAFIGDPVGALREQ